ncbi:hypothetical protein RB623_02985 [Mesorhizobium sp. LHD-90]|uniref:calcium-binding protein n=1 Tax=Mesorhizobium sp. LHD-90 TaxID=3071414 RepID=UPI0027E1EC96|nr:hypothetical protein [Mesorhizobium sp. LHD-90]MDQ6433016.1 hypothetical protein [Mesorhizobium sp. LHD-90]
MAGYSGSSQGDTANAATGVLQGFFGGSLNQLTDNLGDMIYGFGGDDFIFAGNGNDYIEGGPGHDALNGGAGDDTIHGYDPLRPEDSTGDEIVGNDGNDSLYGSGGADVMDGGDGDDVMSGGGADDIMWGNLGVDGLVGGDGNDTLYADLFNRRDDLAPNTLHGEGGNDVLIGAAGNDRLLGGAGDDVMEGADGADSFIFQLPGEVGAGEIIDGGAGTDRIELVDGVSFVQAASIASIEMVEFRNAVAATFLAQQVKTGMAANLVLKASFPGEGDDTFVVQMRAETSIDLASFNFERWEAGDHIRIEGDGDAETMTGSFYKDVLLGNGGNDILEGGFGNDTLDGGAGIDTLSGSFGDDFYVVDNAGDLVTETAGNGSADRVAVRVSYALAAVVAVELLTTTASTATTAINLSGNGLSQTITGNAGNNVLKDGGGAGDVMKGLAGNDAYLVYSAATTIIEGASQGISDKVAAAVDFTLGVNVHVETLATTKASGTSGIGLTGNALKQEIVGNAGANVLHDGGVGAADTLRGLGGNDTYRVFNAGDVIVEAFSQGTADRVTAAVDYKLATGVYVELLTTNGSTGTLDIDLTGNELAQEIIGNAGDNRLEGKGGNDTLRGLAGDDTFVFASALGAANVDTVLDFFVVEDRFLLSDAIFTALDTGTLAAAAFRANTTGLAQDANDRIVYETDTGEVYYDADGTGAAAGIEFATIDTGLALTNMDFSVA